MENPRPEKVAVVDEVKERLSAADATVLTDYRGIDVSGMAELRRALRAAGGDVTIYKNTLVRFAARELDLEIDDMLVGPTALTFVSKGEDGSGDPVLVAKALRAFAKGNENLEIKGGLLGDQLLTAAEVDQLARIAPRDELLAKLAGGLAAPMQKMAGLLEALPRSFAYGLAALIDERGGPAAAGPSGDDTAGDAAADEPEAAGAAAGDSGADEAATAAGEGDAASETGPDAAPADDAEASATEASATEASATDDSATDDSATDDSDSEEG
jgi:large subunit ribosomal protein L10